MKKSKKVVALILAIVTLAMTAAGCGKNDNPGGTTGTRDTLNVGITVDPMNLDPNDNNSQPIHRVKTQIYETLIARDTDGKICGGLAESWEWEDDQTIIFHIRKGVKFHSGDELTAEDVAFSIERAYNMGAANIALTHVDLENCEVVDQYTYKMKLTSPYVPQIAWLEWPLTAISCKKTVEKSNGDYMAEPNGTGPYVVKKFVSGDRVELEANPEYWGGEPAIKYLNMIVVTESTNRAIMLETGELDVAYEISSVDYERILNGDKCTIEKSPSHNLNFIGMTCLYKPFDDVRVRQAVAMAIDVKACYMAAYNGVHELATGFVDPEVEGYAKIKFPEYNPEKAKALLAEAGYPDGFTCDLTTNSDAERIAFCEAIQPYLEAVGIKTNIVTLEMGAYSGLIDTNTLEGLFILGTTCVTVEAEKALRNFTSTVSGALNNTGYRNADYDKLVDEASGTIDDQARYDLYAQCFEILGNDLPHLPVFDKQQLTGVSRELKGFHNGSFECARFKTCSWQ